MSDGTGDQLAALRAESERLRAELSAMVLAEERFRVLFEHSSDAHLILAPTGIIDCNSAALKMLRCDDRSCLRNLHPAALSPERQPDGRLSREKSIEMDDTARARGVHRFEWMHQRMDGEEFPVEVTLTPVRLPDGPVLLVVWRDLTEQRARAAELREQAVQLALQQQTIRRLSTPIIRVAAGVLLVPIVGDLDRDGAATMTDTLLRAISDHGARTVIVDLTGAENLDEATTAALVRIGAAAALLGADAVLAGIQPPLARTLIALGVDLSRLRTTSTAEQAIAAALAHR
ncbi:PAS domain-containing protein [Nannocystis radixulma]|uniref:PAS domain-containing protein n=1 Tax=Nannocystis radixulma TaxID=2995305 RepID=A0ABT5B6F9_9BACT|nr:PAS domain-containing protein [Nannocystis radixulma]MDC0669710.1 PAS domain-containing protein [Nannocystis radixulma]